MKDIGYCFQVKTWAFPEFQFSFNVGFKHNRVEETEGVARGSSNDPVVNSKFTPPPKKKTCIRTFHLKSDDLFAVILLVTTFTFSVFPGDRLSIVFVIHPPPPIRLS